MSEKTYFIYALRNKVSGEIGYIGQTMNLDKRFKEHLAQLNNDENSVKSATKKRHSRPSNPRKIFWMYSNKDEIEIQELESGISSQRKVNERESFFISKYSKEGHSLTNITSPLIFPYRLKFNLWSSSEDLQRYPGGYSIGSSDLSDFLSVGKFLFSRDVFFDLYHFYVEGNCEFEQLKSAYDEMIMFKKMAKDSATGVVNLSLGCGGEISVYESYYLDEKNESELDSKSKIRNRCSSAYNKEEDKFTLNNNCANLCAISVATSGKLQCARRAVFYDVKSDLDLLSLQLWGLALSKIISEEEELFLCVDSDMKRVETKNRLNEIIKLKESLESNQISIENYIIKLGITLIMKLGATPEELIFD